MSAKWEPIPNELSETLQGLEGLELSGLSLDTLAISSKPAKQHQTWQKCYPLVTPIYHSSTYSVSSVQDFEDIMKEGGGYIYSRLSNPTCQAAECAINALEGGVGALVFSSGMAAIVTSLNAFLSPGDHMVACRTVYSGTYKYMSKYLSKQKIEVTWVLPEGGVEAYRRAVRPNTKVLFAETPVNPTIMIIDLAELGELSQSLPDVVTIVDSTYGTPYLQQPLKYPGIDISLHSASKYLGGHTDLVAGALAVKTIGHWKQLMTFRTILGNVMSPMDAALLLRGVKTLHIRMERHSSNAQQLAEFLEQHTQVSCVYYPGLSSHPSHSIAQRQMKAGSGMIAAELKGGVQATRRFVEALRIARLAVSLGGPETLVCHPATMTHGLWTMSTEDRVAAGIPDGYVRISVGLENIDDLQKDFSQALDKA